MFRPTPSLVSQLKLETQTHNFDGALGRELAHTVGDDP